MFATIQLLLGLGLGRSAVVADLVVTAAALVFGAVVIARAQRSRPADGAASSPDVVVEAEAVVSEDRHQPA